MIRLHLTIEAGTGGSHDETFTVDLTKSRSGDNPRYMASVARHLLLELAERVDRSLVGQFGDIGPQRSGSEYTRPLPSAKEWTS